MNPARLITVLVATLVVAFCAASAAFADCFAVVVGKKASADGSVIVGHNEQNGGRMIASYRYIPRMKFGEGAVVKLRRGGEIPQVKETFAFLWQEVPNCEWSDSYFNEHGVVICSDRCNTREDDAETLDKRGELLDGGIGYMLRRLVAQRAKTAKEGVIIATDLINKFGYWDSGRSYVIADPNEAWVLAVARGKRWIAERVPDDAVVCIPNVHVIGPEADMNDKENVMASPGLVEYATERGWYDPKSGKPFSFKDAFNLPPEKNSYREKNGHDPRQFGGQSTFVGGVFKVPEKGPLPFSVKPAHKIAVTDVAKILRSHVRGQLPSDQGPPHLLDKETGMNICTKTTQAGQIFQLRSDMPKEVGCVAWRITTAPCTGVMVPFYIGITETPEAFYKECEIKKAISLEYHFNYPEEKLKYDDNFAFDVFNEVENLAERDYKEAHAMIRKVWDYFEKTQFEKQAETEKEALELLGKDKAKGLGFLTEYTRTRAILAFEKAKALNVDLRTKFWGE
ncbi:MAG: dipeptidase [Planctomycetota bacterium]|jgi:dipeptidase